MLRFILAVMVIMLFASPMAFAQLRTCGGNVRMTYGNRLLTKIYYNSESCAQEAENRRAEKAFREPTKRYQNIYVSIDGYAKQISGGGYFELILMKDGEVFSRVSSGAPSWTVGKGFAHSLMWINTGDEIALPIDIVILQKHDGKHLGRATINP